MKMLDASSAFHVVLNFELVLVSYQTLQEVALVDFLRKGVGADFLENLDPNNKRSVRAGG